MNDVHSSNMQVLEEVDSEINLREMLFILKRNFSLIIKITATILLLSILYTFSLKPQYTASGIIIVDDANSSMSIFDMGMGADKNFLENEIEILNSRTTAERTISALLQSEYCDNLYILGTREYEATGLSRLIRTALMINFMENKDNTNKESELRDSHFALTVKNLRNQVKVSNKRNTNVLNISISSTDPKEAALLVNTMIAVYQQRDQEWASGEMTHLKTFLDEQLIIKERDLAEIEGELKEFQEKEQIFGLDGNADLLLRQLTIIEADYYSHEAEIKILQERKKYVQNQLTEEEKLLTIRVMSNINIRLSSLIKEIAHKEASLISTIAQQGESHSVVKAEREKLTRMKETLRLETEKLINQGTSSADPIQYRQALMDTILNINSAEAFYISKSIEMKKLVGKYEIQLGDLPEKLLAYTRLERVHSILSETYRLMRQKQEEAKISQASQLGKVRIVDIAKAPKNPEKPNKKLNVILGMVLGLGLGVGASMVREYFDNTVKSITEIEKRNLPVLAVIPHIGQSYHENKKKRKGYRFKLKADTPEKMQRRLITHEDPKSPIAEAYRSLRTSLMYSGNIDGCRTILVSSPGPGEGKTTSVMNLAITYANLSKRTLLIDSDLRKPVIHSMFGIEKEPGLTSYLSGISNQVTDIIQDTEIENLHAITSGIIPPNPSELLSLPRMDSLLSDLKSQYDVILFDAPPLLAVTDAYIITKYIQQFILVVRSGVTETDGLNRCLTQIQQQDVHLSGVVMNAVDELNTYGSGYYYNYYQEYYGDS